MNKHVFVVFVVSVCFFCSATSVAQSIVKGGGIVYTSGAPTHAVNVNVDTEVAIDTTTGLWHERSRTLGWIAAGYRVQLHNATTAPNYTPADKQSIIVINNADSLYYYRAGSWRHINRWITDGNKGDITVAGSGATWTINDNAVTNVKFRQSAGLSVVGRSANSTGNVADITATTDGHVLRRSGSTLGFGQVATAGIEDNAVTNAKIASGIAATKIAAGSVDNTEFSYLDGVTSSIQTQLNNKANISHTHSLSDLTQSGAAVGQVPKWNGTAWAPANDETGSGGGGNAPTFVFKDADEIVNNSTTFQNDDHLTFTCPANKRCLAEYHIFVTNANGSEIKFQIEATGATLVRAGMTGAVFDFSYTINQASGTMRTYETNGATSEHGFVRISAVVVSGSANRTVNMQWAQFTAQSKNTTVQQGSWLQWIAID